MTTTINPSRLAEVMGRELGAGRHGRWEDGVCVVEAAAFVAGEPWSDHPECVSPPLAAFLREWNDALDDATRQRLRPYVARIVGTAGDGRDERRMWLKRDWLVRVQAATWMGLTRDRMIESVFVLLDRMIEADPEDRPWPAP